MVIAAVIVATVCYGVMAVFSNYKMTAAARATTAAVSHPQYKLRWVPPKRESLFVSCLYSLWNLAQRLTARPRIQRHHAATTMTTVLTSTAPTWSESTALKLKTSYLSDSERSVVSLLLKYPAVQWRQLVNYHTTLRSFIIGGTDWDCTSQPAFRWLFWTTVAAEDKH